jgi:hypothetical protein
VTQFEISVGIYGQGNRILKVPLGIGDDEDALVGTDDSARIHPLSGTPVQRCFTSLWKFTPFEGN